MQDIEKLEQELLAKIGSVTDLDALESLRISALGKKGSVSLMMRGLGQMDPAERQEVAPKLNKLKITVGNAIDEAKSGLHAAALDAKLQQEKIDITLPARPEHAGRIHPISQVMDEITEIFAGMGFDIAEGPDIENDFNNFTALNIPPEHPARQMHDTFYLPEKEDGSRQLLRTHTSTVQIRTMLSQKPPHRIVVPGRTFRSDSDQTHTPMFHQIEGLVIDKTSHMGHLKGVLAEFCKAFFELEEVTMRFRPSYFAGDHVKVGEGDDWLEILGCGMVNPRVLEHCGLDPAEYQGFAWGMGIDRIAMLKYGIPDLRAFFDSDLRWLKHYGFVPLDVPTLGGGLSR